LLGCKDVTRQFNERSGTAVYANRIGPTLRKLCAVCRCADVMHRALSLQETGARYDKDKEEAATSAETQAGA